MWNPNWKRNLTIRFGSTGGALSALNCRQCEPPLVWFSFQASYVDWWCCCPILCPVNCLFAHFFIKQHLQISNLMWIKRTRWAILGQLQVCHRMGSFAAFSINRCYTKTYSIRIMPFFVWHPTTSDLWFQIPIVTAIRKWQWKQDFLMISVPSHAAFLKFRIAEGNQEGKDCIPRLRVSDYRKKKHIFKYMIKFDSFRDWLGLLTLH